jgi:8-oxo-dGTP pyrophosphatase MutT (NUDIX family)
LDDVNPLDGAKREVEEEAGLGSTSSWDLVSEPSELLEEGCRRASDHHYWHFYRCVCAPELAELRLSVDQKRKVIGESDMIGWIPLSEVRSGHFLLTKPAAHFLGKFLHTQIPNAL